MGDINARTAEEEGTLLEWIKEGKRRSKDKVMNTDGRKFIEWLRRVGMTIINGNMSGYEEGDMKYFGVGETVIDYAYANTEAQEEIAKLKVGERVESDHLSLILDWNEITQDNKEKRKKVIKTDWSGSGIQEYKDKLARSKNVRCDTWEALVNKVKTAEVK